MSVKRILDRLFSSGTGRQSEKDQERFANVKAISMADGTVIEGSEAVQAHFEREQALEDKFGMNIYFQVYRLNLQADSIEELQGEKLDEVVVDGDFVTGTDTVAAVIARLRPLLEERTQHRLPAEVPPGLKMTDGDHISFVFNGHPMRENRLFYAEHFMMLPAWVQVFLHDCEFAAVAERARELSQQ